MMMQKRDLFLMTVSHITPVVGTTLTDSRPPTACSIEKYERIVNYPQATELLAAIATGYSTHT